MKKFQFLIGRIGSGYYMKRYYSLHKFQFLIGRIGSERLSIGASGGSSFQFLIGRIGRNIPEKNVLCVLGFNSL